MRPVTVAIVAVEDFSPFHFSVPCIMFSEKAATKKRFEVQICAEVPGVVTSVEGFSVTARQGFAALTGADIVIVPWWGRPRFAHRSRYSMRWFRPGKTAPRWSGYALAHLFSVTQDCSTADAPLPTGSLKPIFRRVFPPRAWISTPCTSTMMASSPRPVPPLR